MEFCVGHFLLQERLEILQGAAFDPAFIQDLKQFQLTHQHDAMDRFPHGYNLIVSRIDFLPGAA